MAEAGVVEGAERPGRVGEEGGIGRRTDQPAGETCVQCGGTGIVKYWEEFSCFEDRRSCHRCEAGSKVEGGIRRIVSAADNILSANGKADT